MAWKKTNPIFWYHFNF